ncbi:PP2C family protein-serine/threonine phosphatase [Skermania piniformis]|uniref:Protein phosphatase 2C domain-containing protein n=1 Tax=Skermania pinensis TaxID=39122 RepID=A0ABX8SE44_9ACTN|nr:PP2C family serine/threonine-protein phosphatase [Skermania piniformis]QXQ13951.1 protein phosphatase 2C domain-containing protein [Skermania piniformis]
MTLVLRYAARSDRGLVRSNNEDSVYAGARLLALADGMGGHAAGEVASQLVIAALAPLDDDEPGDNLLTKLQNAIFDGNAAIADQVEEAPELDGMGTTLTAVLFSGKKLGLAHIGDSRAYLLRGDELAQITRDDTFVQSLVDEGRITAEQAHTHPQRSLIMRALTGNEIEPTLTMREAKAGDRYLLCSDGLSDVVSDETIRTTMSETEGQDDCADRLIELALRSGGPDNVTVVVADVIDLDYGQSHPIVAGAASTEDEEDAPAPDTAAGRAAALRPPRAQPKRIVVDVSPPPKRSHKLRWTLVGVGVLVALVVATIVGDRLIQANYYVGADKDRVAIMRGVPYSMFGHSFQQVAWLGCVDRSGKLELVSPTETHSSCRELKVDDLQPTAREQVRQGLPSGSQNQARDDMDRVVSGNLLPTCAERTATSSAPPASTPTTTPAAPSGQPPTPPPPSSAAATPTTTTPPPPTTTTPPQKPGENCRRSN